MSTGPQRRERWLAMVFTTFVIGGCSQIALVGRNRSAADGDAAVEDVFTPVDLGAQPDVRPVPDVLRTVDVIVDLDAGAPPMDARDPGDSEARPVDRPRAEVSLVGIDVTSPDAAMKEMGIDAGPMEERPPTSCVNDRECMREMVPSRCDLALSQCVPR